MPPVTRWSPIAPAHPFACRSSSATCGGSPRRSARASHVLNACADRYHFTVGLAASLLSGKVSLLPSTHTPEVMRQLRLFAPDVICLTDEADCTIALPRVTYPRADARADDDPLPGAAAAAVPAIDAAQLAA